MGEVVLERHAAASARDLLRVASAHAVVFEHFGLAWDREVPGRWRQQQLRSDTILRPPTPLSPPPTAAHVQTRQWEWRDGTHTSTPFLAAVSATIGCTGSVWVQPRMHPSTQLAMIRAAESMPIISGRCRRKCSARGRNSLYVHTRHRGQPTPGATTAAITTSRPATSRTLQACRCRSRRCPSR